MNDVGTHYSLPCRRSEFLLLTEIGMGGLLLNFTDKDISVPRTHGHAIRFVLTPEMYERTIAMLDKIDASERPTEHATDLANLVIELTELGFDYFFLQPLRLAKSGILLQKTAGMGLSGAIKVVGPILRKVVKSLDAHQLRTVSEFMRDIMR